VFVNSTGLWRLFRQTRLVDDPAWDPSVEAECDWVPGCYYLIRREVIEQVGLFDPRFFLYYEEVDHCRRVKAAGWKVGYYPYTQVIHLGGESAASVGTIEAGTRQLSKLQVESELLYFRKHYGMSGVLFSAVLSVVAQMIDSLKGLLRGVASAGRGTAHRNLSCLGSTLAATRFGGRPTR
jgi:GT2 family glycosyltransferase